MPPTLSIFVHLDPNRGGGAVVACAVIATVTTVGCAASVKPTPPAAPMHAPVNAPDPTEVPLTPDDGTPTIDDLPALLDGFVSLFDGKTLGGWQGDTEAWSVHDGAIRGQTDDGGFLLYTERDFESFRLILRSRLVSENNHLGICFWGKREEDFGYGDCLLVIPPDGGMWDYIINNTPNREKIPHDPPFDPHEWHTTEILANFATGEVQVAVNGFQTTRYRDVDPKRLTRGPIGLQLHGGASTVEYKDLQVEIDPKEPFLITLDRQGP